MMNFKTRRNDRTRLMWVLELAVVLPAAALVLLGAWYLKSVQRDRTIEAAFQRDFTQMLAISEKQINERAYSLADDVRTDFPGPGEACSERLDRMLAAHPYVAHVFVYSPETGLVFRSQPHRLNEADFRNEANDLSMMHMNWLKMEYKDLIKKLNDMKKKNAHYYFFNNWPSRGDKHIYQSVAMFLDDGSHGETAIGGMVFDAEYLHDHFYPDALDSVLSNRLNEGQSDKDLVLMIHPRGDWTPMATSAGWDKGSPEVERNMEAASSGLVLAIKLRGTTLAAIGQRFVRTSFLILGALALLLTTGIVLTHRNITREMALARLKSDFVSNVSHELRTPLSLIRLYAETLEMGRITNPEKSQEYYRIIRKESERLTGLISNILDFSRIEAGRKEYDFRETDISELVRNTLESYRYQIEQNGFQFEEKIDEDVPPLRVDREAIARSLLNPVNNSLKYSQNRKYLGINLYRANGAVKLEVIDHGIGIPHDEQNKIFEKFYRVGDPLEHQGQDLSLVRHIVRAHGGEVMVDSSIGEGSKFTIVLPVNVEGPAVASAQA